MCSHALCPFSSFAAHRISPKKISENRIRDIFGKHGEVCKIQSHFDLHLHACLQLACSINSDRSARQSSDPHITACSITQVTQVKVLAERRFAYVGFHSDKAAAAAKRFLHNTYIDTSKIEVSFAPYFPDTHAQPSIQYHRTFHDCDLCTPSYCCNFMADCIPFRFWICRLLHTDAYGRNITNTGA